MMRGFLLPSYSFSCWSEIRYACREEGRLLTVGSEVEQNQQIPKEKELVSESECFVYMDHSEAAQQVRGAFTLTIFSSHNTLPL